MRRTLALLVLLPSLLLASCDRGDPGAVDPPPPAVASVPPAVPGGDATGEAVPPPRVPADIVSSPSPRAAVVPREVDNHDDLQRPGVEAHTEDEGQAETGETGPEDLVDEVPVSGFEEDAQARDDPPAAPHWDGIANLRFGMQAREVPDRWRGDPDDYAVDDGEACFYLAAEPRRPARSPALMFERGRFVRYDVDTPALRAPGGGAVGMDVFEILERYGEDRVQRHPHKYSDGEYLRIEAPDSGSILLFETDAEGVVTEWRIGVEPQVDYVEGCS